MASLSAMAWVLSTLCCIRFIRQDSRLAVRLGLGPCPSTTYRFLDPGSLLPRGGCSAFPEVIEGGRAPANQRIAARRAPESWLRFSFTSFFTRISARPLDRPTMPFALV